MKKSLFFGSISGASLLFIALLSSFDSMSQSTSTNFTIAEVFARSETSRLTLTAASETQSKTDISLSTLKFSGNENKDTRRPQGIAVMDNYVINSWYFTDNSTSWKGNCKLTITDLDSNKYFNLVPVQPASTSTNEYVHIDSHAGGLTIIDHYLYMVDNYNSGATQVIRIFDLENIVIVDSANVKSGQKFIKEYDYLLPEVDRMIVDTDDTDDNFNLSYLSTATIDGKDYFLTGNFYMNSAGFKKGGKSHILLIPIKKNPSSFSTIDTTSLKKSVFPKYPSGNYKGETVSRIQGAVISNNRLIISRSYSNATYQLLILEYDDILASNPTLEGFFSGKNDDKTLYNNKNWYIGCEDLCYDRKGNKLYTVTEFRKGYNSSPGRKIYSGDFNSFIHLIDALPSTN